MTNASEQHAHVASEPRSCISLRLGRLVATPGAIEAMVQSGQSAAEFLQRHARGDWGTVGREDGAANDRAVETGERVLSAYFLNSGVKLWVITEADRSATTILLPDEY